MNVNKRLDRFRQWGKEKMGGEIRTDKTDDFKSLENEMNLRHEGMEKLHNSMNVYVKALSKKTEGDSKEKNTAIANLGSSMTKHGEDFQDGSKFGECLISLGQTNERIARMQDTYAANASSSWLDACERSLAQMKEYQNARKKLETRRLAYDTSVGKVQKAKKDDYRIEEELRSQKAKYEESQEDVYRRMQDIIDAESDNVQDMYSFLEAEIAYYDRAREALLQLRQNWPAAVDGSPGQRRQHRAASGTLSRVPTSSTIDEDLPAPNPSFRNASRNTSASSSPHRQPYAQPSYDDSQARQGFQRAISAEAVTRHLSRTPSEPPAPAVQRLRPNQRVATAAASTYSGGSSPEEMSPDRYFYDGERSSSPATSQGTNISRTTSCSNFSGANMANGVATAMPTAKKAPPPPPPSRSTKPPPPPPPPMKRSALSSSSVPSAY